MVTTIRTESGLVDEETGEIVAREEMTGAFRSIECLAAFLGFAGSKARNGNNYALQFEVPIFEAANIVMLEDGLDVTFTPDDQDPVSVGEGGFVQSTGVTRDAEGVKHLKVKIKMPTVALKRSMPTLARLLADDTLRGRLTLTESQGSFDLTSRA